MRTSWADGQTERDKQTNTAKDKQTERQTDQYKERGRERETDKQTETDRQINRLVTTQPDIHVLFY